MKKIIYYTIFEFPLDACLFVTDIVRLWICILRYVLINGKQSIIKKNSHSQKLYILGNGPSLKDIENKIDNRNDVNLCTVNFAVNTELFNVLKPEIHILVDPAFFIRFDWDNIRLLYDNLQKVTWEMTLIVPLGTPKKVVDLIKNNKNITIKTVTSIDWTNNLNCFNKMKFFLWKKNLLSPTFQNVTVACIFSAINMGYKHIELYGVEHSWLKYVSVDDNNVVCLEDQHFYGTKKSPWKNGENTTFKYNELLTTLSKTFGAYMQLRDYSLYIGGVNILNMTPNSFIDAFQRQYNVEL